MTRELHFYTNAMNAGFGLLFVDYVSTMQSIEHTENNVVMTTQLALLRNAWDYIADGWRVFIHIGDRTLEVKEHMEGTEKDIREGLDICRLLLGGTFGKVE